MASPLVALALLAPGLALADPLVAQATPPPPPPTAPAPAPSTPPAAEAPAPVYHSYLVGKGGWFGTSEEFQGQSFDGAGAWEVALGTGLKGFGIELGAGAMTTNAGGLEIRTIPLLLTLRLGIPIAMLVPHVDVGAGIYFNNAKTSGLDTDETTAGWHAGGGVDVLLGRVLVGADARYMGISPTFSTLGEITLDRYEVLFKAGVRF